MPARAQSDKVTSKFPSYMCVQHTIHWSTTCSSDNKYNLTWETQSYPAGSQVGSLVVLPLSAVWLGRWPDVGNEGEVQTELVVLIVMAVTEHHYPKLQNRTCNQQDGRVRSIVYHNGEDLQQGLLPCDTV